MQDDMQRQWSSSHLFGGNSAYVDALYEAYLADPSSVPDDWRSYFDKLPRVASNIDEEMPHEPVRNHFLLAARNSTRVQKFSASAVSTEYERKQVKVLLLIQAYRTRGHQHADLDPLGLMVREPVPDLDLVHHGLSQADLDTVFQTGNLFIGKPEATLREIL